MNYKELYERASDVGIELADEKEQLNSKISELKDELRQLHEYTENLKNCSNCKKYYECKIKYYCGYCKAWKYDGIKQKDRKID